MIAGSASGNHRRQPHPPASNSSGTICPVKKFTTLLSGYGCLTETLSLVFGGRPLSEDILRLPSNEDSANYVCFCLQDGRLIQFGDYYWFII